VSMLENIWYQKPWYRWPLMLLLGPVTILFAAIAWSRRHAFAWGLIASHKISAPVIIVGNISVGGNGKTPLVIHLAQLLKQQGLRPGVLSRGYGGKSAHYPLTVLPDSSPTIVGDEPVLMKQHLGCPMVVDPNRPRGARFLVENHHCNLIICDDGLQHYALERDIEIAVMDGKRRVGNGFLLPMGPLREGQQRLASVDFVVVNGGSDNDGEHLMELEPGSLVNVKNPSRSQPLSQLCNPVVAIAGIGNPQRFFNLLLNASVKLKQCLIFADHHQFTAEDLPRETLLMTEKDAVKCRDFAFDDWWYLPVSAKLTANFEQQLLSKLRNLKREKDGL
jgi:tetraacyldisaccharide 4'-kinase